MNDNTDRLVADLQQLLDRDKIKVNDDPEINAMVKEIIASKVPKADMEIKSINDYLAKQKVRRDEKAKLVDQALKVISDEVGKVEHLFTRSVRRAWPLNCSIKKVKSKAQVARCCDSVVVSFGSERMSYSISCISTQEENLRDIAKFIEQVAMGMNTQIKSEECNSCSC